MGDGAGKHEKKRGKRNVHLCPEMPHHGSVSMHYKTISCVTSHQINRPRHGQDGGETVLQRSSSFLSTLNFIFSGKTPATQTHTHRPIGPD